MGGRARGVGGHYLRRGARKDTKQFPEQPLRSNTPATMSAYDYESVNIQKTEALHRLFDLTDDDDRAILTAFIQGNFEREEMFPETRQLQMSSGFSVNDKKIETIFSGTTEEAESETTTMTTTMKIQNEKPSHKRCARCDIRFRDEGEICFREWDGESDAPLCGPCWDKTEEEEEYGSQTCDSCGEPCPDDHPFTDEIGGDLFRCEECHQRKLYEERIFGPEACDDRNAPNVWPYKKCSECEERSSCGNYDDDNNWICENCADPDPTNWNEETLSAYEDLNGAIDASGNAFH